MSEKQFFGSLLVTRHKHVCLFLLWRAVDMPNIEVRAWFLWSQVLGSSSIALRGDPYPFYFNFWRFENLIKVLGLLKEKYTEVQICTHVSTVQETEGLRKLQWKGRWEPHLPAFTQPLAYAWFVQVPLSEVQWRPKRRPYWRLTSCLLMVSQIHLYIQCFIGFCIFREYGETLLNVKLLKTTFCYSLGSWSYRIWPLVLLQHFVLQTCMTASPRLSPADEGSLIAHFLCGIFNRMPMNVTKKGVKKDCLVKNVPCAEISVCLFCLMWYL